MKKTLMCINELVPHLTLWYLMTTSWMRFKREQRSQRPICNWGDPWPIFFQDEFSLSLPYSHPAHPPELCDCLAHLPDWSLPFQSFLCLNRWTISPHHSLTQQPTWLLTAKSITMLKLHLPGVPQYGRFYHPAHPSPAQNTPCLGILAIPLAFCVYSYVISIYYSKSSLCSLPAWGHLWFIWPHGSSHSLQKVFWDSTFGS